LGLDFDTPNAVFGVYFWRRGQVFSQKAPPKIKTGANLPFNYNYAILMSMMTADAILGVASTASLPYFKESVTYPDNTQEAMDLVALPYPVFEGGTKTVVQRGGGLAALSGDKAKEQAAAIFAEWLAQPENNLGFVTEMG
jgi:multiple sugar transport system substrate-binding protein